MNDFSSALLMSSIVTLYKTNKGSCNVHETLNFFRKKYKQKTFILCHRSASELYIVNPNPFLKNI